MNLYYYLFYKLSKFINKKGNNEYGPIFAISVLLSLNIGLFFTKILPVTQENYQRSYEKGVYAIVIMIIILNYILFLNKRRVSEIMNRYQRESETNRKLGNALVILYVVVSLGLIFFL